MNDEGAAGNLCYNCGRQVGRKRTRRYCKHPEGPVRQLSTSVPKGLYEKVQQFAVDNDSYVSEVLTNALRLFFSEHEKDRIRQTKVSQ